MERERREQAMVATATAALLVPPLAVSLVALVQRAAGHAPTPIPVLLASLGLVLALGGLALSGRGPLAAVALRVPSPWGGRLGERRGVAALWLLLALVGTAQAGRLSLFLADPALRWGSTFPPVPEGVGHMCMSAYVHAAELSRRPVENVYDERYYPAFRGGSLGHTAPMASPVEHLGPWLEDPFEYPPPFLLLPRFGLLLTNDYLALRTAWFALRWLLLFAGFLLVARAVEPARGRLAALLGVAALSSLPVMFDLQFGQLHLTAVTLALLGMLACERDRPVAGGALLAAAIVFKVFPALLLVVLLVRGRLRAVAWTAAWGAAYTALALAVLGWAPFAAFFAYHLPRIASGAAFSFFLRSDLTIASNWGIYGVPIKLGRLGVPGMTPAIGAAASWLYTVPLLWATVVGARRITAPRQQPLLWLAVLVLASLRSPLAPNVYVGAPALWLLTLLAAEVAGRPARVALFVVSFVAIGGLPPMPGPEATIVVWSSGQILMLALGFHVLLRRPVAVPAG